MSKVASFIVKDVKDESGVWIKSFYKDSIQYNTVSYKKWLDVNYRCKVGGSYQRKKPSYIGCRNDFKDFQEFVEWSRKQVGYSLEGYQLDKDLLFKGNKIYSPETCVFLPGRVNNLLIKTDAKRGKWPIGVCFDSRSNKFVAQCKNGTKLRARLGYFSTPELAFNAYKKYKEKLIKQVAEEYKDVIDIRAYIALINYEVEIND